MLKREITVLPVRKQKWKFSQITYEIQCIIVTSRHFIPVFSFSQGDSLTTVCEYQTGAKQTNVCEVGQFH